MERSRLSSWKAMLEKFTNKRNKLQKQVNQELLQITSLDKKRLALQEKIDKLNAQEIAISQHALDRYRERINGDATDAEIYQALVTDELKYFVDTLGNGQYPVDGHQIIVKDRVLVTVI